MSHPAHAQLTSLLTLDTRSYDILVVNGQGYPICEFKDFKLRKATFGVSPKRISALSLTTEPVRIPPTVVSKSRFFRSQDEQIYERLYRTLDYLALRKLHRTLERRLPRGNSVSAKHSDLLPYLCFLSGLPHTLSREADKFGPEWGRLPNSGGFRPSRTRTTLACLL